jgi:glycine reductase
MAGLGAELSRYAKMTNVSISPHIAGGVEERDFENAVKVAGFKTAAYLALAARAHPVDGIEVYDLDVPNLEKAPGLPRIAYYYQIYSPQHDHLGMSDPCFYGTDVRNLTPTIIHPNEVLDGGIVGHHTIRSLDTYTIQNHGVIKELYRRHGKELIFAGVVVGVADMDPIARTRKAMRAASLIKHVLGAEGVIITKIHGGMPHVDMALVGEECEKLGVRTAVFTQPVISYGTLADTLLFNNQSLDLIITVGSTLERVKLPLAADRFLGGTARTKVFLADPGEQHANDPVINQEEMLIAGVHDHLGGAKIIVKEY